MCVVCCVCVLCVLLCVVVCCVLFVFVCLFVCVVVCVVVCVFVCLCVVVVVVCVCSCACVCACFPPCLFCCVCSHLGKVDPLCRNGLMLDLEWKRNLAVTSNITFGANWFLLLGSVFPDQFHWQRSHQTHDTARQSTKKCDAHVSDVHHHCRNGPGVVGQPSFKRSWIHEQNL